MNYYVVYILYSSNILILKNNIIKQINIFANFRNNKVVILSYTYKT